MPLLLWPKQFPKLRQIPDAASTSVVSRKRGNKKNKKKEKTKQPATYFHQRFTLKALKREMEAIIIILGQRKEVKYPKGQRQLTMG
jgi:hypothetical protein